LTAQKRVTGEETQLEQYRTRRHNLIHKCKIEEIQLPKLKKGESQAEESDEDDGMDIEPTDKAQQEAEDLMKTLDFSSVKKKDVKSAKQFDKENAKYVEKIQELSTTVDKISPNMKAIERFDSVQERLKVTNDDYESSRKNGEKVTKDFEEIKQQRINKFNEAFKKISESIDQIYKDLTGTVNSRAYLTVENTEEPYLEGIKYTAIPPNKRFRDMEQLSGGEKTVAALALLFAIHSYRPAPFFILDEIDAALDPGNVRQVLNYIRSRSGNVQFIVISLKEAFYEKADALIGIYRDVPQKSTGTLTLDLVPYSGTNA